MANNPASADQALQEAFELDGRPKLALLGDIDQPVRLTTQNGSLLLLPPTGISIPVGTHTLTTSDGTSQKFTAEAKQANVFRMSSAGLEHESSATLATNTGSAGQLAPPLVAKDRKGKFYRLAESLLKKPIVILFWSVADSEANEQLSQLGAIASRFGQSIETVAVHTNPKIQKDALRLYLSQPGTSAQLWGDPEIAQQFGVTEFPALAVIDKQGRVSLLRVGPAGVLFDHINDYLETL